LLIATNFNESDEVLKDWSPFFVKLEEFKLKYHHAPKSYRGSERSSVDEKLERPMTA
jgi:hypothetical protein